ncbi:MAG TPA: hypothetical protein VGL39_23280 [Jatrophihabitantaceae bacterium]
MKVTQGTLDAAIRMGARAGSAFAETGVPARNPFLVDERLDELAKVWRRAYFAATARG